MLVGGRSRIQNIVECQHAKNINEVPFVVSAYCADLCHFCIANESGFHQRCQQKKSKNATNMWNDSFFLHVATEAPACRVIYHKFGTFFLQFTALSLNWWLVHLYACMDECDCTQSTKLWVTFQWRLAVTLACDKSIQSTNGPLMVIVFCLPRLINDSVKEMVAAFERRICWMLTNRKTSNLSKLIWIWLIFSLPNDVE